MPRSALRSSLHSKDLACRSILAIAASSAAINPSSPFSRKLGFFPMPCWSSRGSSMPLSCGRARFCPRRKELRPYGGPVIRDSGAAQPRTFWLRHVRPRSHQSSHPAWHFRRRSQAHGWPYCRCRAPSTPRSAPIRATWSRSGNNVGVVISSSQS